MCTTELPKPQLGEPKDLSALRMQATEADVLMISQTLDKLLARDTVQVELIPEKKGLFLKHVEYQVTSQARNPTTATTHYSSNSDNFRLTVCSSCWRSKPYIHLERCITCSEAIL